MNDASVKLELCDQDSAGLELADYEFTHRLNGTTCPVSIYLCTYHKEIHEAALAANGWAKVRIREANDGS